MIVISADGPQFPFYFFSNQIVVDSSREKIVLL